MPGLAQELAAHRNWLYARSHNGSLPATRHGPRGARLPVAVAQRRADQADLPALVRHLAARWQVEVLFAGAKAVLGLDHYQLMTAPALLRFWTLVLAAYAFLEEEQARLQAARRRPGTIGEARWELQSVHDQHLLAWLHEQFQAGAAPEDVEALLAA